MKIKTKLSVTSLLMALIPAISMAVIISWMAINSSKEMLRNVAMEHLISVRENNKAQIERYFEQINNQLLSFSDDRMIIDAMVTFKEAVRELEEEADNLDILAIKKQLEQYYSKQFAKEYSRRNSHSISAVKLLTPLDTVGSYLQYLYIHKNKYPLGEKNSLSSANDSSQYSQLHGLYHSHINNFLGKFGYYDIFLVDPDSGRIVYSVFKEIDYATSLKDGIFAKSGLGIAFNRANKSDKRAAFLEDFNPYTPSYEDPAAFIATPIFEQGKKVGILVFQMPIDKINNIMTYNQQWESVGMGKSGESYLIGPDYKARSISRFLVEDKESYISSMAAAGVERDVLDLIKLKNTNIGLQSIQSVGAKTAISGKTGEEIQLDYRNISVLSAFSPLDIKGVEWAILSEIDEAEAFLPAENLQTKIIVTVLIGSVIVVIIAAIIAFLLSNRIAAPLTQMANTLKLGKGNLNCELDESGNDEIADIAHCFNSFVNSVRQIVGKISEYSLQLATLSEQVSTTALQTNGYVNNQQMQIEQVATAMSELTITVQDVSRNAEQAAQQAKQGDKQAQAGELVIEGTIGAINQLNYKITDAAEKVSMLEQDGEAIGTVLDVIRGIAEQTNLLALNAAIEAARAGEQGRGFAVVADEVRTLASRTQDSTEEIQTMIEKLQKGTKLSAKAMEDSVKLAEEAVNQGHGGTSALQNITQAISSIDEMVEQIASTSNQQSAVSEEINRNVNAISDSAKSTVSASDDSARAGETMAALAADLAKVINQFKF